MRARNIKPGFFENEELAECNPFARILFAGLWCMADKEGRLEDRPKKIKRTVLGYDDVDADELLDELASRGFILRYEVQGFRFIQVLNFSKHQRPHSNEKESVIPQPDPELIPHGVCSAADQGEQDFAPRSEALRPDSLIPDSPKPRTSTTVALADATPLADAPFDLYLMLCEENGVDPSTIAPAGKNKQLGIAKHLLEQGFGLEKSRRCLRWLKSQDWRTGAIDLGTVLSEGPKWELNGCPEFAKPRASPRNGARPEQGYASIVEWNTEQEQRERQARRGA